MDILSWVLVGVGIALILLEVIVPGGISCSVGISTICIGVANHFGWLQTPSQLFFSWAALSIVSSVIGIIFVRLLFAGKVVKDHFDEDQDAIGK